MHFWADFDKDPSYLNKVWLLGSVFFGIILGAIPFSKILEFFIPPLGNTLSSFFSHTAAFLGGCLGWLAAIPAWSVIYLAEKLCELHDLFNKTLLCRIALVYAGTYQKPEITYDLTITARMETAVYRIKHYTVRSFVIT